MSKRANEEIQEKRAGIVTIVGRPNSGKSTLLNHIIGIKVSITSPQPQTTRFPIKAVFNDDRGQLVFVDTPGIFARNEDTLSSTISHSSERAIQEESDIILYLVDITRPRGLEENRILGLVRKSPSKKVLVLNKIDRPGTHYRHEYAFLQDEVEHVVEISALKGTNVSQLVEVLFSLLPVREPIIPLEEIQTPLLNMDRRMYLEELIREKVFLNLRKEVPYSTTVHVTKLEDKGDLLRVKAEVVTTAERYKGMIIGKGGQKIKDIGHAVKKEIEVMTNRKANIDLTVKVDPHWVQEWI